MFKLIAISLFSFLIQSTFLFGQDSLDFSHWDTTEMNIDNNFIFHWTSVDKLDSAAFSIEHFRYGMWKKVGEVKAKYGDTSHYEYQITPFKGRNRFRVSHPDTSERYSVNTSPEVLFVFGTGPTFQPLYPKDSIWFSEISPYVVFSSYGQILLKGRADVISVKYLKRGLYYISFGTEMTKFLMK